MKLRFESFTHTVDPDSRAFRPPKKSALVREVLKPLRTLRSLRLRNLADFVYISFSWRIISASQRVKKALEGGRHPEEISLFVDLGFSYKILDNYPYPFFISYNLIQL